MSAKDRNPEAQKKIDETEEKLLREGIHPSLAKSIPRMSVCLIEAAKSIIANADDEVLFDHFKRAIGSALDEIGLPHEAESLQRFVVLEDLCPVLERRFDVHDVQMLFKNFVFCHAAEYSNRAHVEMCHCGKHGRIVLHDGFIGLEFCFQWHAQEIVRMGIETETVSQEESRMLLREIEASGLPQSWEGIDLAFHWQIEQWNMAWVIRIAQGQGVHEFLTRKLGRMAMPADFRSRIEEKFPL